MRMMELADEIKEVKTVCWCGKKAICNARYNKYGIVRDGEQIMLGANDEYIALCRKHFMEGKLKADDWFSFRLYSIGYWDNRTKP